MTKDEYHDKLIDTLVFTVVEILQGFYVNHERSPVSKNTWKLDLDEKTEKQEKLLNRMSELIAYKTLAKTGDMAGLGLLELKQAVRVDLIRKTKELMEEDNAPE